MEIIRSRSDRDCVLELAMQIPHICGFMGICVLTFRIPINICFFPDLRDFYAVSCGHKLI